jgi:hypothetical protein
VDPKKTRVAKASSEGPIAVVAEARLMHADCGERVFGAVTPVGSEVFENVVGVV